MRNRGMGDRSKDEKDIRTECPAEREVEQEGEGRKGKEEDVWGWKVKRPDLPDPNNGFLSIGRLGE